MLNGTHHGLPERKADPAVLARAMIVDGVSPRALASKHGYASDNSVRKAVTNFRDRHPVEYVAALGRPARKGDPKEAIHVEAIRLLDAGKSAGAVARDLGYANPQALVAAMRRGGKDHADRVSLAMTDACRMPVGEAQVRHRVGLVTLGGAIERRQAEAAAETPLQVIDRLCAAIASTEPPTLMLTPAAHALLLGEDAPEAVERNGVTVVRVEYESVVLLQARAEQAIQDRESAARKAADRAESLLQQAAALIAEAKALRP